MKGGQSKPAIVAIGYNRPDAMERLLNSIGNAVYETDGVPLIISIDRSGRSEEVAAVAEAFSWPHGEKVIRMFDERQGLKNHIIQCGDLSEKYGAVILLEDDIVAGPAFYSYASQALDFYQDEPRVIGPALYAFSRNPYNRYGFTPAMNQYDNYFAQFVVTWGQCWRKEHWLQFRKWLGAHEELPAYSDDLPKEVLSWTRAWSKYMVSFMAEKGLYYAAPYRSMSTNFHEAGEHRADTGYESAFQVPLMTGTKRFAFAPFEEGVKYDCFMERQFDDVSVLGVPELQRREDLCVDLNATRCRTTTQKYLLTTRKLELPVVKTFALRMRPIDENISFQLEGDGVNLYRLTEPVVLIPESERKPGIYAYDPIRMKYETHTLNWRLLAPYAAKLLSEMVVGKLKKLFKRR